jgi:hypothetical protein
LQAGSGVPPSFLRAVFVTSVFDLSFFHYDYSPTAPAAPFLRPLVPSGSMIRCEQVQVYHRHPQSRVLLDPVYHIIYPSDYLVWAFAWGLELGRFHLHAGWVIEPHFVALMVTHAVG